MAYYEGINILSVDPVDDGDITDIPYGDKRLLNKSVNQKPNGKWGLAEDGQAIGGSICGFSYGKVQVLVDAWDATFINGTSDAISNRQPLVGAAFNGLPGFVKSVPDFPASYNPNSYRELVNGRGSVTTRAVGNQAGTALVRAAITYGG